MPLDGFHDRLREAIGDRPTREVGDLIGVNPESIKRILAGHQPTTDFVTAVCRALDISADWLLLARGPMHASKLRIAALRQLPAEDLIGSLTVQLRRKLEDGPLPTAATSAKPAVP